MNGERELRGDILAKIARARRSENGASAAALAWPVIPWSGEGEERRVDARPS